LAQFRTLRGRGETNRYATPAESIRRDGLLDWPALDRSSQWLLLPAHFVMGARPEGRFDIARADPRHAGTRRASVFTVD
jgi:hypothetical protein